MKQAIKYTCKTSPSASYGFYEPDLAPVSYMKRDGGTFTSNIFGEISEPKQFEDLIAALEVMEECDEMVINLQSNGGCVSTTDMLVHAMRKCKGHIHMVATGQIASAATILLLEAHSFELSDNFAALIHCGSTGAGGTLHEFKVSSQFQAKYMERVLRNTYAGFFTDEELDRLVEGKDWFIDAEEWMQRSEARNEWFKVQTKKIVDAIQEAEIERAEAALKEPDEPKAPPKKITIKRKPKA